MAFLVKHPVAGFAVNQGIVGVVEFSRDVGVGRPKIVRAVVIGIFVV